MEGLSERDRVLLLRAWRGVCIAVRLDRRAVSLQRSGKLGTYAEVRGQEIVPAAIGAAMAEHDILVPAYRESAALVLRGVPIFNVLAYWGGDLRGLEWPESRDFPYCVPIGTNIAHAVGAAFATRNHSNSPVVVAATGDGGTNRGEFFEGINFASIHRLRLVIVVNDNGWAISVPRRSHSAVPPEEKARGVGAKAEIFDARDPVSAVIGLSRLIENVRKDGGPAVAVIHTRRVSPHTTSDDPNRYRDREEMAQERREWDIPDIFRRRLMAHGIAASVLDEIDSEVQTEVQRAAEKWVYRNDPDPDDLFRFVRGIEDPQLEEQRRLLLTVPEEDDA